MSPTNTVMDLVALTNHAAAQSDRWLLIASVVAALGAATVIWRWIVGDYVRRVEQMTSVIATNTAALAAVKEVISACRANGHTDRWHKAREQTAVDGD